MANLFQALALILVMSLFCAIAWTRTTKNSKHAIPRFIVIDLSWKLCVAIAVVMMAIFASSLSAVSNSNFSERAAFVERCAFLLFLFAFPMTFAVIAFFSAALRGRNAWPYGATEESGRRNISPEIKQAHESWLLWTDNEVPRIANAFLLSAGGAFAVIMLTGLFMLGQFVPTATQLAQTHQQSSVPTEGDLSYQTREVNISVSVTPQSAGVADQPCPERQRRCTPSRSQIQR